MKKTFVFSLGLLALLSGAVPDLAGEMVTEPLLVLPEAGACEEAAWLDAEPALSAAALPEGAQEAQAGTCCAQKFAACARSCGACGVARYACTLDFPGCTATCKCNRCG